MSEGPIYVDSNPVTEQVKSGIRNVLLIASSIAGAAGMAHLADQFSSLLSVAGPVATFIVFIWEQRSTRKNAKIKRTLAEKVPDDVATVK